MGVFLIVLVAAALLMHYGFASLGFLPDAGAARSVTDREFFKVDYTFFLNIFFGGVSLIFLFWKIKRGKSGSMGGDSTSEKILFWLAVIALAWLAGGTGIHFLHN